MTYWTQENTAGFTDIELRELNAAQSELQQRSPDIDPQNIADKLNNIWRPNMAASELINRAGFKS